ncbi:MAG TPA: DUF3800 domain-containing protein [Pyrinomonadaceae bacterium]|jgi:hypothetical protein
MAIYTAYFDESGSPDEGKALVVAGYVANAEQWVKFDVEWRAALASEGIKRFHMRDFAHSRREFESWKGDEKRRTAFMKSLVEIIRRNVRKSFSQAIILDGYNRVNEKYQLAEQMLLPYSLCAFACARSVNTWAKEHGYIEPVNYVYEDGAKHKQQFKKVMEHQGYPEPVFRNKDDNVAFQAADLVAWESLKFYRAMETRTFKRFRQSYAALYSMPYDWYVYLGEHLEGFCQQSGIPLRVTPQAGDTAS